MKKIISLLIVVIIMTVGCQKVNEGKFTEGTYFGSVETVSYGKKYVTTAVVYINDQGLIKSVFIDSTYLKDEVNTTKKVLGDAYGMKSTSANAGTISEGSEWYEQVEVLEEKIIEEQGIDWIVWQDDAKTKLDALTGFTITADSYIEAVSKALEQAK